LKGSPAADAVSGLCGLPIIRNFASHYCDGTGNGMAAYVSLGEQFKSLANPQVQLSSTQCDSPDGCVTIAQVAASKMMGLMCGTNPAAWVDNSNRGTLLTALAGLVGQHWSGDQIIAYPTSGNDGMVPFVNSCKLLNRRFDEVPTSMFYVVDGNHNSITCNEGDNSDSDTQKPCEWIKNMFTSVKPSGRQGVPVGPDQIAAASGAQALVDESERVRHRLRKHRAMPTKKRAPHQKSVRRQTTTSPRRSW